MIKLEHYTLSIKGRRKNNQDSYLFKKYSQQMSFFAVADGMGGVAGGEIASILAIKTADDYLISLSTGKNNSLEPKIIIKNIYNQINKAIKKRIDEEPGLKGMGTTLVSVLLYKGKWIAGNVGDSRLYTFNKNNLYQITEDHSFIQDYINKYGINVDSSIINKYGNVLLKVLNGGKDEPDLYPLDSDGKTLEIGDQFLLCSDGLVLNKIDREIKPMKKILKSIFPLKWKINYLVRWAYKSGSNDNITALAVKITGV